MTVSMNKLLSLACANKVSDVFLSAGNPPILRLADKNLRRVDVDPLDEEDVRDLAYAMVSEKDKAHFEETRELDFSFNFKSSDNKFHARFRGNLFFQQSTVGIALRKLNDSIPTLKSLGVPEEAQKANMYPSGLVLVAGATGSGKSTTIAALMEEINCRDTKHLLTIEDPVEYVFEPKKCHITQREVGHDTHSFAQAIKYALRQNPDVCLVGELRDVDSIRGTLTLAETGHLVFGTLHANTAESTVTRILSVFSGAERLTIQNQLADVLRAVICQQLLPHKIDMRRVLACEMLFVNTSVKSLIRGGRLHQVQGMMQVGQEQTGSKTMNQSLFEMVVDQKISLESALEASTNPEGLDQLFVQHGL